MTRTIYGTRERPILFSGPMVRAILDGTKTQTRRVVKPAIDGDYRVDYEIRSDPEPYFVVGGKEVRCPCGKPGDRLWVRETIKIDSFGAGCAQITYLADGARGRNVHDSKLPNRLGTVPSIHMPRNVCRLLLDVTATRVERVQEISGADAEAEGVECAYPRGFYGEGFVAGARLGEPHIHGPVFEIRVAWFRELWKAIYGPESWHANPWVWVVEFRRVQEVR